jgi:hypothetical protein
VTYYQSTLNGLVGEGYTLEDSRRRLAVLLTRRRWAARLARGEAVLLSPGRRIHEGYYEPPRWLLPVKAAGGFVEVTLPSGATRRAPYSATGLFLRGPPTATPVGVECRFLMRSAGILHVQAFGWLQTDLEWGDAGCSIAALE